ncbi:MAG: hypothetical protein EBS51_02045 [Planctomycetia bacterium]|nr:hypothetical protein [Planctomycetia bacterium]
MSEPLSEAAGCALLTKLFRARGYSIRRNVAFREKGISFDIDGWDAKARVGFEFLSSEKDDHDDLSLQEFERLKDAEQRGELFIFVVDEVESLSAAALRDAAESFLDDVAAARKPRRAPARRPAATTKPVGRAAVGPQKRGVKKTSAGSVPKKAAKRGVASAAKAPRVMKSGPSKAGTKRRGGASRAATRKGR